MVKLSDIYANVRNPLDNPNVLQKIILAYAQSDRTDLMGSSNLYESLITMNKGNDGTSVNLSDKDEFMVRAYNQWIKNMLSLDDAQIEYLKTSKGMDARKMQQYLKSFGQVSSADDITRLTSNPLFDKEMNGWELPTPRMGAHQITVYFCKNRKQNFSKT